MALNTRTTQDQPDNSSARGNGIQIKGADGPIEIKAGEFYLRPKARPQRMMKNHLSRGARQVYERLELGTMGFQQELAITMDKKGRRPLTTGDIAESTELNEGDVRRFLDELEQAGVAERRARDGGKLRKGQVLIYSWAVPRQPKEADSVCAHTEKPGWIPDSFKPLLAYAKRCRQSIPDHLDEAARTRFLPRGEEIARKLEEAEKEAARYWEEVGAYAAHNKEERTDRTSERTSSSPPSSNGHEPHVMEEEDEEPQIIEVEEVDPPAVETLPAVIPPPASVKQPIQEAVPTFDEFRKVYPGEVDPGSKPAFIKLNPADKILCVRSLPRWMACRRWQTAKYIPAASNFILKRYWEFETPPDRGLGETSKTMQERQQFEHSVAMLKRFRGMK